MQFKVLYMGIKNKIQPTATETLKLAQRLKKKKYIRTIIIKMQITL